MRKVLDFLAPLGLLVVAGAALATRNGIDLPGGPRPWLLAGFALVLVHLVLRWDDVAGAVGRRQLRHGGNTTVFTVAVLGILVALNYLAARHPVKKDLTENQRHSLSEQTKKVVQGLQHDVQILYFERASNTRGAGVDRVRELGELSPRMKVEFVDPVVSPSRAREHDVRSVPTLVVVRGDRREKVTNNSEQDITNALIKVTREGQKTVCFVHGQGERDVDDFSPQGLSSLKSALEESQYATKKVFLAREPAVPQDCSVVVVPGPQKDLTPAMADVLRTYVGGGGKLLALIEPVFKEPTTVYASLLSDWNIEAGRDLVVDISLQSQMSGFGPESPLAARYPHHEITKDFRFATLYHTARSVKAGSGKEGVSAQDLVETSEDSWAETSGVAAGEVKFDAGQDRQGPVPLAAAATVTVAPSNPPSPSPSPSPDESEGTAEAGETPKREGRVVAFGDSDFVTNGLLGALSNRDLALNAVAWLSEDADLISIRPKEPRDQRVILTRAQSQNVALLALGVIPGLFVVLGVWTWWKRR